MHHKNIQVKQVSVKEIDQVQTIGRQTFVETFSLKNSEENLKKYLESAFSTEKLKAELNERNSTFYLAELDGRVIGYLKINFGGAQTEIKTDNALEIERIYVLKEFHGKKVGQILYDKAFEISVEKRVEYVWLGVWEKNQRAIQFYKKNGFIEFDRHVFKLGDDKQTDIMMKLNWRGDQIT